VINATNNFQRRKEASMGSIKKIHCIMADLGKLEEILKNLETMPECNGCTTMVRRGRRIIRRVKKDLALKKEFKVNWVLVENVIQILPRLIALIDLVRLKGFFNICKCLYGLLYECCREAWQTLKNGKDCCWS
jgi:hypothetical protein